MNLRFLTTARVAGLLYLVVIVCAGFAEVVRSSLMESGDAAATAENIRDAEWLFRAGFASDVVAFSADVGLALAFFVLFRPVDETLSLLAAFFRLAQAAVLGINMLNQFLPLLLLDGGDYLTAFDSEQIDALVLLFLEAHGYGYLLGLVFFSFSTCILGYLIMKSGLLPRVLGVLLIFAAAGYLADSFASFLFRDEGGTLSMIFIAPAVVGELLLCAWLLVPGISARPDRAASDSSSG